jgi:hypothetical protein
MRRRASVARMGGTSGRAHEDALVDHEVVVDNVVDRGSSPEAKEREPDRPRHVNAADGIVW